MPARRGGWEPLSSVDVVPGRRLELEPVPSSRDDIDAALEELSYLNSREATVNLALKMRIDLFTAEAKAKLVTKIDGETKTFADRRAKLEQAIAAYVELHHDEVFGDQKTADFNFGTLKLRAQADGIELREGVTAKMVKERLEKKAKLHQTLIGWAKTKLFGLALDTLLRIKSEPNHDGIKKAYLAKKLTLRRLKAIGYQPCGGEKAGDTFSIDVGEWKVTSQSQKPADTSAA